MRTLPRLALAGILVAGPLAGCGATGTAHLVVTQSTDAALNSADHLGHMAPATFAGITISIKNIGTGPIRGLTVTDMLPAGFHFYQVTTVTGNAIRTGTQDPSGPANPTWGLWTLPAPTSGKDSELVLSFKVQVATKPGSYDNTLRISGVNSGAIDQSPLTLVVEPRPSLTVATAAATGQVVTGGTATYVITVANVGSAVAKGVAASVSLPGGFLYLSTTGFEGNSARVEYVDPTGSSLLPVWGTWNVPGAVNGAPGVLRITFQVRILPGVQPGIYDMTTAITASADVPVQVLGGQAPLAVGKGTSVPISMQVGATSLYAARGGPVMYVITVENDSIDAAQSVTVTDSLPSDLTFANTNSVTINGAPVGSNLVPAPGGGPGAGRRHAPVGAVHHPGRRVRRLDPGHHVHRPGVGLGHPWSASQRGLGQQQQRPDHRRFGRDPGDDYGRIKGKRSWTAFGPRGERPVGAAITQRRCGSSRGTAVAALDLPQHRPAGGICPPAGLQDERADRLRNMNG